MDVALGSTITLTRNTLKANYTTSVCHSGRKGECECECAYLEMIEFIQFPRHSLLCWPKEQIFHAYWAQTSMHRDVFKVTSESHILDKCKRFGDVNVLETFCKQS